MPQFDQKKFVSKLGKKMGGVIPSALFYDIMVIINNYLYEEILNDRPIYLDKIGVITQILPPSKKTWSRRQNKIVMSRPTKRLVFRPHDTFNKLLDLKRKNLSKPDK